MSESRNAGSIQVLSKLVDLLNVLADAGELTAGELAEQTGEPRSSVYRLLASLQEAELVEPATRRATFRLGLGLFRLGTAAIARFDERQAALPALEELHDATGETVFLCIRRHWEAVCIERLDGQRVQSLALRLGGALPLHVGGAPRTLLAFESEEFWDEYVAHENLARPAQSTLATRRTLFADLKQIRAAGYAISDQDVTPGIAAIGAPLFDHQGRIQGSISISGTRPMILDDRERTVSLVLRAAEGASKALGYSGRTRTPG